MGAVFNLGEIEGINIKELFNGSANNTNIEYTLNDSVKNYKMLLVMTCANNSNNTITSFNKNSKIIIVDDLLLDSTDTFRIYQCNQNNSHYSVQFYFSSVDKFKITSLVNNGWASTRIYKIIGIF